MGMSTPKERRKHEAESFSKQFLLGVVYRTAAAHSFNLQTRDNVPLTPLSWGALPWDRPSVSTPLGLWR
jgi:hypothetical protein